MKDGIFFVRTGGVYTMVHKDKGWYITNGTQDAIECKNSWWSTSVVPFLESAPFRLPWEFVE